MSDTLPDRSPRAQPIAQAAPGPETVPAPAGAPRRANRRRGRRDNWAALAWLAPALVLILGVVLYPAVELVRASGGRYSITGLRKGSAGWDNYSHVLSHTALSTVVVNTVIWVVAVVAITLVAGLGLAQFLSKEFFGRKVVRWAVIVPWAASLVITARLFTLIYDYYHGILNRLLQSLHIIDTPIDFLGDDRWTMAAMVAVGVFVSIPESRTTYTRRPASTAPTGGRSTVRSPCRCCVRRSWWRQY